MLKYLLILLEIILAIFALFTFFTQNGEQIRWILLIGSIFLIIDSINKILNLKK